MFYLPKTAIDTVFKQPVKRRTMGQGQIGSVSNLPLRGYSTEHLFNQYAQWITPEMKDKMSICCVSQVTFVPTVGYDDQFEEEEKKSPVICSNIGSQCRFVVEREYGYKMPFRFRLSYIQYECKHAQISDLMKIGGACHRVISEFPFDK